MHSHWENFMNWFNGRYEGDFYDYAKVMNLQLHGDSEDLEWWEEDGLSDNGVLVDWGEDEPFSGERYAEWQKDVDRCINQTAKRLGLLRRGNNTKVIVEMMRSAYDDPRHEVDSFVLSSWDYENYITTIAPQGGDISRKKAWYKTAPILWDEDNKDGHMEITYKVKC
jgi:hypothetical protein